MHFRVVLLLLFLVSSVYSASAQHLEKPTDSSTTWHTFKYDANASWRGIKHAVTRPLHWKKKDFTKLGGIVLGTVIVAASDRETSNFFRRQDDDFPQPLQEFGFYFASPQNYLMANAGLYGFGLFTKNEQVRKTAVLVISSSITAGYIQIFSRALIGRARPFSGDGPFTFKPLKSEEDYVSFPSGHTVLGITMAHSIAKQFESPWVKAGIYAVGSIPAATRLMDGAHWLSDVVFGAALSIVVVDSIDKYLFESNTFDYPKKKKLVSWNLKFTGSQIGVVGTF